METVDINVGGTLFTTYAKTLSAIPGTRLDALSTESPEYNAEKQWYFFDRNPEVFNSVLDLLRTEDLHVPTNICVGTVVKELEFWKIPRDRISDCCFTSICKHEDSQALKETLDNAFNTTELHYGDQELTDSTVKRKLNVVWKFMEHPSSSIGAKVFSVVYFSLVLLTTITFVLGTHEYFRQDVTSAKFEVQLSQNFSVFVTFREYISSQISNPKMQIFLTTEITTAFFVIESICVVFFSLELVIRFISAPSKVRFLKGFLNILDIVLVSTMIIAFAFHVDMKVVVNNRAAFWVFFICKGFIIFRLCRFFRLIRHIDGLRVMVLAMKASLRELFLLILIFFITLMLFSGVMYYVEFYEENDTFIDIPITMWWCMVTMTTVGYGDVTPTSYPGYAVASLCAISGLLLMSMPIAIMATNFGEYYEQMKIRKTFNKFKQKAVKRRWSWTIRKLKKNKVANSEAPNLTIPDLVKKVNSPENQENCGSD